MVECRGRHERGLEAGMRLVILVLFLSGCTLGQAPHVVDTTLTGAIISSGGVELNPLGFPMVVVAKVATEDCYPSNSDG